MRIYVDTSVFGGLYDDIFKSSTEIFFHQIREGMFILCVSDITRREIEYAPQMVKDTFSEFLPISELVPITEECLDLRDQYINHKILTKKSLGDALHVAVASINQCDMIVSWNFKHIVHYDKIKLFNAVNQVNGISEIFINSPMEVINYGEEEF